LLTFLIMPPFQTLYGDAGRDVPDESVSHRYRSSSDMECASR
jgi:hypothetical protein